jgi:TatA/E family protein of Tat protein translocase
VTAEIFSDQGLIVIAVLLVVLFGSSKIPELARSIGRAKRAYQEGLGEDAEGGEHAEDAEDDSADVAQSTTHDV